MTPNTQAALLLTAPLLAGRKRGSETKSTELLSPAEYQNLMRHLHDMDLEPADLLTADLASVLRDHRLDPDRLTRLLQRGLLLSQAISHWQARCIWVVGRADREYPQRLKARLKSKAPIALYDAAKKQPSPARRWRWSVHATPRRIYSLTPTALAD